MSDTLLSVLTGESWSWDSDDANQITFNKDGTGTLICRAELNVWIAAEFDWKPQDAECLEQRIDLASNTPKHPSLLSQCTIEITLTKRRIPRLGDVDMQKRIINEELLTDAAFLPKQYAIKLEVGQFLSAFDAREHVKCAPRFARRITFDKSPYPPREEWKNPDGAPDALKFWEWKEFSCHRLPEKIESSGEGIFSKILGSLGGR
ncbi:hypothetical protein BDV23DRAFT_146128 [Aspergillus alliaceus]|uniref:Uncharacterized protein n=1 Tax=Petromyces alliaceus TaxID=209559 RepID=A0A5N6FTE3_PETAA|nr:uncharacterized protein BDW43DRAFT_89841 [Aspergillus alliaceus]KAB8233202.1 hypothetical protein BDW43DRAFT_89841 [Aspergillus alliaceus]KAE8395089.1 hypothetical protein BDV23DRAFT_146128 [Aspergillus alliaceus]